MFLALLYTHEARCIIAVDFSRVFAVMCIGLGTSTIKPYYFQIEECGPDHGWPGTRRFVIVYSPPLSQPAGGSALVALAHFVSRRLSAGSGAGMLTATALLRGALGCDGSLVSRRRVTSGSARLRRTGVCCGVRWADGGPTCYTSWRLGYTSARRVYETEATV